MMISWLFFLLGAVNAKSKGVTYHVRSVERRAQKIMNPNEFVYSHSDDGGSKTLPRFLVDIFETEELSDNAMPVIRMAMNKFLLKELNAFYEPQSNELESVGTEILDYSIIETSGNGRALQNTEGTELEMEVTLTFDNEPSPDKQELQAKVQEIMSDLAYFVTNLTSIGNAELDDVTEAYRREIASPSPTQAPEDNTDAVTTGQTDQTEDDEGNKNNIASKGVTASLIAATFIALVVYLVFRRKEKADAETPKGDMMYVDVENDMYSMDRSLESSQSPRDSLEDDSVFSGIDSPTSAVNKNVRSTKSLMSGFTNASASTIRVSNHETKLTQKYSMAGQSSLFAFSEDVGAFDDVDLSDRDSPRMADPPSLTKSDLSDDSEGEMPRYAEASAPSSSTPSSSLQGVAIEQPQPTLLGGRSWACTPTSPAAQVLADLEVLESSRGPSPRDPTPSMARAGKTRDPTPRSEGVVIKEKSKTVSYNPFNCNPILSSEPETAALPVVQLNLEQGQSPSAVPVVHKSATPSPSSYSAKVTKRPDRASPLVGGNEETPLRRNIITSRRPSTNGTMETPLKRNTALASTTPRSNSLERSSSQKIHLEWEKGVEAPGTVGTMSAKATSILSGMYVGGAAVATGNRSRASTMDGGSRPGTPKSSKSAPALVRPLTPSRRETRSISQPGTPQGAKSGSYWLGLKFPGRAATAMGDDDYIDNLSRPSTPGGEFNNSLQAPDDYASQFSCLPFGTKIVDRAPPEADGALFSGGRRHGGDKLGADGTAMYQTNAMQPLDWSYKAEDNASIGNSTISENDGAATQRQFIFSSTGKPDPKAIASPRGGPKTPMSEGSAITGKSAASSHASASRQLINDLVWLEKKIAGVKGSSNEAPGIDTVDSLSYVSKDNDAFVSDSSNEVSNEDEVYSNKNDSVMSSIVCRDCYAPPGKLHIVIHSTKDGPAVHTVKDGSSLEGHVFPGDLIIAVDNVDTRSFTAEQVMKMMASKSDRDRKITVLHFEEED